MSKNILNRRDAIKTSALALGAGLLIDEPAYPKGVNTNSSPSTLKITDMRVATVKKPGPSPCPIIRIDTNQACTDWARYGTERAQPMLCF